MNSRALGSLCLIAVALLTYTIEAQEGATFDVSGRWELQVETDLGSGSPTVNLKQEGAALTGDYQGTFGALPVTGTISGNEINFSFVTSAAGQDEIVAYSGTFEQNSMRGDVRLGSAGSGTFVGRRASQDLEAEVSATPVQQARPGGRSLGDLLTREIRAVAPRQVAALLEEVDVRKDVFVAETPEKKLLLDVYSPKGRRNESRPCVIWIHGGGLTALTKDYDLIRWCAAYTARAGFVSMSIDYRLRPEAELPAAIIDAKTAVRFVRAHADEFGIDPNRIAIAGESAGGYLATFVAFAPGDEEFASETEADTSEEVKCAVIWYTPAWRELPYRPLEYISEDDPPALFIHGDQDSLVNPADSETFVDRYRAVGADAELLIIENAEHGFFDVNSDVDAYNQHMKEALDASVAFLRKHLGN